MPAAAIEAKHLKIAEALARKWGRTDDEVEHLRDCAITRILQCSATWTPGGMSFDRWLWFNAERDMPQRRIRYRRLRRHRGTAFSQLGTEDFDPIEFVADPRSNGAGSLEGRETIARHLKRVPVRARRVIRLWLVGHTFTEIAAKLGYPSYEGPRYLFRKAIKRLRRSFSRSRASAVSLEHWAAARPDEARKIALRGASKGRAARIKECRKERRLVGWANRPALHGRILRELEQGQRDTQTLAELLEVDAAYCRNTLCRLKRDGLVERVSGGGLGGPVHYAITDRGKAAKQ